MTRLLLESLVQVMFGGGLPSAEQLSITTSPSFAVWLVDTYVMVGGPNKLIKGQ